MVQESKRRKTWKGKRKGKQKIKVNVNKYLPAESPVRYHCGGWSEELNSRILLLAYMVYL
jgi:hypothetical protein